MSPISTRRKTSSGHYVSLSSDVIREYREYERTQGTQGTCLNTGLMPLMSWYIDQIQKKLADSGIKPKLYFMKSSGGVGDVEQLVTLPLNSVLSGHCQRKVEYNVCVPTSNFTAIDFLDFSALT